MKVSVMIVDTVNEITQYGTIEEPVMKGCEIINALKHFGVLNSEVEWTTAGSNGKWESKFGIVKDTTKVVNVVAYKKG